MAKIKVTYQCETCGAEAPQYMGRCSECGDWNSMKEKLNLPPAKESSHDSRRRNLGDPAAPQLLKDIATEDTMPRFSSGFPELDRVLGGGFIPGAYLLFGGDPGIGKSTLMLQAAQHIAKSGKTVLYVAGEESPHQIKLRAQRLGLTGDRILVFPETQIYKIRDEITTSRPDVVIIDSIQSVYDPNLSGTPGNASQIRECAGLLMGVAKSLNVTILLVGHVTKDGVVSGPKLLEHTVDGVFYFEGEQFRNLRILRAVKNRFGNTNEIGLFEMGELGLAEVTNPSELFLSESGAQQLAGSAIVATMEGNRPILAEVQALVGTTTYASPRRIANGLDLGRLHQIVAVLERRLGVDFSKQDIYVNVTGGLRITEPAADLAIAMALVSASHQVPLKPKTVIAGEIGLTGEVRTITQYDARVSEAEKLGFERIILPKTTTKDAKTPKNSRIQKHEIRSLMDALTVGLDPKTPLSEDRKQAPPKPTAEVNG